MCKETFCVRDGRRERLTSFSTSLQMLRMQVLLERKKEAGGIKSNVEQCIWAETHETCDRESRPD